MLVDIHRRAIYGASLLIEDGNIVSITEDSGAPKVYILPGFVDAHIHIESSMATPGAFALAAVRHGTVAVVSDPHEIANVMGIQGVDFMLSDSEKIPLEFIFGAPSCVPATMFESSGANIGPKEIADLLAREKIGFLSEMMNFPGVINDAPDIVAKLKSAKEHGKPVDGHAPGISGSDLVKYVAAGISTDHECTTLEEARAKIALGMKILIREGSAAKNLDALHPLFSESPEMVMLCCDDLHPDDLVVRHMNSIVADLVNRGYDIFDVLRASSINPVTHYKLPTGLLRAGDSADFILTEDLSAMKVLKTFIRGRLVYDSGRVLFDYEGAEPVNNFNCTQIVPGDIKTTVGGKKIRVIEVYDGQLFTGHKTILVNDAGSSGYDLSNDILKIVVKERYTDGPPAAGFIKGFGLTAGALASSVAHDSHNIISVGTSDEYICRAVNRIIEMKGGLAWCGPSGEISLPLNIAGIISSDSVEETARLYKELTGAVKEAGSSLTAPFMTMSFMALLVIPELKIGDKGLFDVSRFKPVSLIVEP